MDVTICESELRYENKKTGEAVQNCLQFFTEMESMYCACHCVSVFTELPKPKVAASFKSYKQCRQFEGGNMILFMGKYAVVWLSK